MPVVERSGANGRVSRREFLQHGAAAGAAVAWVSVARGAHAAGQQRIRVGLIGCGGRGSGAALNAINAGPDVTLVAMADLFAERVQTSLKLLRKQKPEQIDVTEERCFAGFDAYQKLIASGVDVVLIAAASHFHPRMLKAAVEAGKHVFIEKPAAVNVPDLKIAMQACQAAAQKGLNIVAGLCWRYDLAVRETIKRVIDGQIGQIVAIQETYITSPYVLRQRQPGWTEMQYQCQNWYHFNWLAGDQTLQQLIHSLDKASWALGDKPPESCWGHGGRQVCTDPKYGDLFDHHAVVFEYADGVRVYGFCRAQPGCYNETSDVIFGTRGRCDVLRFRIDGEKPWRYEGQRPSMYDVEHQELFAAIRAGQAINNGHYLCLSTMLALMAQAACQTGQKLTWQQINASQYAPAPSRYDWDAEPPVMPDSNGQYPTAMPGITKFS